MNLQNQIDWIKGQPDTADMFDGLHVPAPFDAERVKSSIVLRCGLLTPIYSQPYVMREAIAQWSYEMQWNFEHLAKMVLAEYDPIHNYDRTETRENEFNENTIRDMTADRDIHNSVTDTETLSGSDEHVKVEEVSAENESGFQNDRKETATTSYGKVTADQSSHTTADDLTEDETIKKDGKDKYTLRAYGNIGVTTNFQMLEGEKELISKFNPYKWIAEQFENALCVMVY